MSTVTYAIRVCNIDSTKKLCFAFGGTDEQITRPSPFFGNSEKISTRMSHINPTYFDIVVVLDNSTIGCSGWSATTSVSLYRREHEVDSMRLQYDSQRSTQPGFIEAVQ